MTLDGDADRFTLTAAGTPLGELVVPLAVKAATNAAGAAALALELGVPFPAIAEALRGFGGVARRFERRGERDGVTFVDDYAHLPTEVAAAIATARQGGWRRVIAVFQPHRYSRTASLWQDFAGAFDGADAVVLTDVYPAGETPIAGVSGRLVVHAVVDASPTLPVSYLPRPADLVDLPRRFARPGDVVLTLGAGNLTALPDTWIDAEAHDHHPTRRTPARAPADRPADPRPAHRGHPRGGPAPAAHHARDRERDRRARPRVPRGALAAARRRPRARHRHARVSAADVERAARRCTRAARCCSSTPARSRGASSACRGSTTRACTATSRARSRSRSPSTRRRRSCACRRTQVALVAANGRVIAKVPSAPAGAVEIVGEREAPKVGAIAAAPGAANVMRRLPKRLAASGARDRRRRREPGARAQRHGGNDRQCAQQAGGVQGAPQIRFGTFDRAATKGIAALAVLDDLAGRPFTYVDVSAVQSPVSC